MKKICQVLIFSFLLVANGIFAQEKFSAMTSLDTVYLGNYFELSFTLENVKGQVEFPDLSAFEVLSGPNMASSISIINGNTSSTYSYSYRLMPSQAGVFTIGSAQCETSKGKIESKALSIIVLENPEGIQQHNQMDVWKNDLLRTPDFFKPQKRKPVEEKSTKKKRKLIRI